MKSLSPGDELTLHSYKHDKNLHRIWSHVTILEETADHIIVANKRTKVIESNGRFWFTKEPSVSYFFKHHWYNAIGIIKKTGISYYCNLSSPITYDEEALKYIDYDLDIKVFPDYNYKVLDRNEYNKHRKIMGYPDEICAILENEMIDLKQRIASHSEPFDHQMIDCWYDRFLKLQSKKNIKKHQPHSG